MKRSIIGAILAGIVAVGCGVDEGNPAQQSSRLERAAAVCPSADADAYQTKATRAAAYLLGGDDPFGTCESARACASKIRGAIEDGRLEPTSDGASQVCGRDAATFTLNGDYDFDEAVSCAAELDACWGAGVSGFFLPESAVRDRKIRIDPEPARLLEALSGGTGSTAAAIYVNSGTPVTAILWPSSWTVGSAAAGMPCSTTAAAAGTNLYKVIAAGGAFRRCL